jgi:hypothetical protein
MSVDDIYWKYTAGLTVVRSFESDKLVKSCTERDVTAERLCQKENFPRTENPEKVVQMCSRSSD